MTEPKSETQQAAASASSDKKSAATDTTTSSSAKSAPPATRSRSVWRVAFALVLLLAVVLGVALWYEHQNVEKSNTIVLAQMRSGVNIAQQAGDRAQKALSMVQAQSTQIAGLQRMLKESQAQQQSLEQSLQSLTDSGSNLVLVNDIDHLVTIANQQLLLSGNVPNAVIALETAQAQLARASRPSLSSLQQTINGDLDRLRAVSTIDVALLSSQLAELEQLIARAPLLVPDAAAPGVTDTANQHSARPPARPSRPAQVDAPWWRNALNAINDWSGTAWSSVRQDLGQFISVRRASDPAALLMSPEQASQLRENLQLRIMTAQLALMTRQPKVWASEMQALTRALDTRYDARAADTAQALKLARRLADVSIKVELPTVNNSLQAIEALRQAQAKAAEQKASQPFSGAVPENGPSDDSALAGAASTEPRDK
ncbi:MAG TPA: uroporphyrinogen-III C-methyltransferase [Paralcaligenes sp.]